MSSPAVSRTTISILVAGAVVACSSAPTTELGEVSRPIGRGGVSGVILNSSGQPVVGPGVSVRPGATYAANFSPPADSTGRFNFVVSRFRSSAKAVFPETIAVTVFVQESSGRVLGTSEHLIVLDDVAKALPVSSIRVRVP